MPLSEHTRVALQAVLDHLTALGPQADAGQVYVSLTWSHQQTPPPKGYPWWSDLGSYGRGHWHLQRISLRQAPEIMAPVLVTFEGKATLPWAQALLDEPCPMVMPETRFQAPVSWPEHVSQMSLHWLVPRWRAQLALDDAERDHVASPSPATAQVWQEAQWAVTQLSDRFQRQSLDHATFVTYWQAYQAEPPEPPEERCYETFEDFLWVGMQQAREWFNGTGQVDGEVIARWEEDWLEEDTLPDRETFFWRSEIHPVWADPVWSAFLAWHTASRSAPEHQGPSCVKG
jgi:hypothetical protein